MCTFCLKVRKNDCNWVKTEVEFDFSIYGYDDNIGQEQRLSLFVEKAPISGEFKDAYLVVKFQIVAYDQNEGQKWIKQAQEPSLYHTLTKILDTVVPGEDDLAEDTETPIQENFVVAD